MEHARSRPLVLGFHVPQLELPPRASLFCRRAVLPSAGAAAYAPAVLRTSPDALADLLGSPLRLAGGEPRAAHRLERRPALVAARAARAGQRGRSVGGQITIAAATR